MVLFSTEKRLLPSNPNGGIKGKRGKNLFMSRTKPWLYRRHSQNLQGICKGYLRIMSVHYACVSIHIVATSEITPTFV